MKTSRRTRSTRVTNHRTLVGRKRRARTHDRIVAAAMHVFAEKGPDPV